MTHLPLTLGVTYTTAAGNVPITRIEKHGKWAYDADGNRWRVATGKSEDGDHPEHDITGRVEPAPVAAPHWQIGDITCESNQLPQPEPEPGKTVTIKAFSLADTETPPEKPLECWMIKRDGGNLFRSERSCNPSAIRMIEAAPIAAELARVTAALEHWRQEVGKLHSQVDRLKHDRDAGAKDYCALMGRYDALQVELARVTAERDEAVAVLQHVRWPDGYASWTLIRNAFLAKFGGKP